MQRPDLRGYAILLVVPVAFLLAVFVAPLAYLVWSGFREVVTSGEPASVMQDLRALPPIVGHTLRLAATCTVMAVSLAFVIAYVIVHSRGPWAGILMACLVFSFWLSALVRALSWLLLLSDRGPVNEYLLHAGLISTPLPLVRSEFGVLVGMVHFTLPVAALPLVAHLRGLDGRLMLAARSLGAGPIRRFWRVLLPVCAPSISSSATLSFVFGLGFFIVPSLLGSGRTTVISEHISTQVLEYARWGAASMSAVVLLAATALVLLIARGLLGRGVFAR